MDANTDLTNAALSNTVSEIDAGLLDTDLGGGTVKKPVASLGQGKRTSTRTLVATKKGSRWFFVFDNNERANISKKELEALQDIAFDLLRLNANQLDVHIESEALLEVFHDDQE